MSRTLVCSPPALLSAALVVAHPSSVGSEGGKTRAPNLDANDKLVKRGLPVSWGGLRGNVLRSRTGRCLVEFPGDRPKWLSCRSVQVVVQ